MTKKRGSKLEFESLRNLSLMKTYKTILTAKREIRLEEVYAELVESPSPRFWVSEERARLVIRDIERGRPVLETMRPTKREMFEEIYKRYAQLKKNHPEVPLEDAVFFVVNSPAPKYYMKAAYAIGIITRMQKRRAKSYDDGRHTKRRH